MGIRIDGSRDLVSAADGSLTVEGLSLNVTGVVTASQGYRVGTAYTVSIGGTVKSAGGFVGDGSQLTGVAAGVWTEDSVGVSTIKVAGINTTSALGTLAGAATSQGAIQAHGNISVVDGMLMTDQVIDKSLTMPAGKNGILVGPVQIASGKTLTLEAGCTLLIA